MIRYFAYMCNYRFLIHIKKNGKLLLYISGLFAYECLNTWSEAKINSAASCLLDIGIFGECQLRNKQNTTKDVKHHFQLCVYCMCALYIFMF
jgi:hypothetical protein